MAKREAQLVTSGEDAAITQSEIARVMECPIGTVRSRLFEARERLKKLCETK